MGGLIHKPILRICGPEVLPAYAKIPMTFEAHTVFHCEVQAGLQGFRFYEQPLDAPFTKDYDLLDGGPLNWPHRFDLKNWGFIVAELSDTLIAGATIAHNTPEVHMLKNNLSLAILWDIRVVPQVKGKGLGRSLFEACCTWARKQGCTQLTIETQNNNPGANRFYTKMGCEIEAIRRFAYPELPEEVQILWTKRL